MTHPIGESDLARPWHGAWCAVVDREPKHGYHIRPRMATAIDVA